MPSAAIGETKRDLDVLGGMAALHQDSIEDKVSKDLEFIDTTSSLVILTGHDATPVYTSFGRFAHKVYSFARYLVPRTDRPGLKAVTLEEYQRVKGHCLQPKSGCLELFAQKHFLSWHTKDGVESEAILVPPNILVRSNASTALRLYKVLHR